MKAFQGEGVAGAKVLTGVQRGVRLVQKLTSLLNPFSIHRYYDWKIQSKIITPMANPN